MFTTIAQTALALVVLHTLVCVIQAVFTVPRLLADAHAHPAFKKLKEDDPEYYKVKFDDLFVKSFFTNIVYRHWLTSDLHLVVAGVYEQGSRVRAFALCQAVAAFAVGVWSGSTPMDAVGFAALDFLTCFALGAFAVYSGALSATPGDRKILHLN
jgi:hypothetical protein